MTATNDLPSVQLCDSVVVNHQGNTRKLPISNLAQIVGNGSGGDGTSLAAEIGARIKAVAEVRSERRNGRVWHTSSDNLATQTPPKGTDQISIATNAG